MMLNQSWSLNQPLKLPWVAILASEARQREYRNTDTLLKNRVKVQFTALAWIPLDLYYLCSQRTLPASKPRECSRKTVLIFTAKALSPDFRNGSLLWSSTRQWIHASASAKKWMSIPVLVLMAASHTTVMRGTVLSCFPMLFRTVAATFPLSALGRSTG
jgi:hypothetical protein